MLVNQRISLKFFLAVSYATNNEALAGKVLMSAGVIPRYKDVAPSLLTISWPTKWRDYYWLRYLWLRLTWKNISLKSFDLYSWLDDIHWKNTAPEAHSSHPSTHHSFYWSQLILVFTSYIGDQEPFNKDRVTRKVGMSPLPWSFISKEEEKVPW